MTFRGHIQNGVVVFDQPVALPDGTPVAVQSLAESERGQRAADEPTLFDRLQGVIGKAQGLPADFAAQHDHYIHGTPRR